MTKVILGVSQRDFYNFKFFEKVSLMKDFPIKVFKEGNIEYIGVEVTTKKGFVEKIAMKQALQTYAENAFGRLKDIPPIFYTLEI